MKRLIGGLLAILLFATGLGSATTALAQNFTVKSFQADYYLGADKEGRSTLRAVEKVVAELPDSQNHDIERVIPENYDGHPTSLHIVSVTDQTGAKLAYATRDSGGNEILQINGLRGSQTEQTYVITYTQRDVTKYVAGVPEHQFYHDVTGGQWQQPISEASVTVHTDANISPTLTKHSTCAKTSGGVNSACTISEQGNTITASATDLPPGTNMAISIGFTPGTFRAYQPMSSENIAFIVIAIAIASIATGVGILLWACRQRPKRRRLS